MATPNYGYEKRQKELAKKRKKEDKLKAKAERKHGDPLPHGEEADETVQVGNSQLAANGAAPPAQGA